MKNPRLEEPTGAEIAPQRKVVVPGMEGSDVGADVVGLQKAGMNCSCTFNDLARADEKAGVGWAGRATALVFLTAARQCREATRAT